MAVMRVEKNSNYMRVHIHACKGLLHNPDKKTELSST